MANRGLTVTTLGYFDNATDAKLNYKSETSGSAIDVVNWMALYFLIFFAVLYSPVLGWFDQLIKLYCTVLAVN